MPIGYLWTVAIVSWGVACALTRWPRLGSFSAIPALLVSELPFIFGYLLVASTVLALADGDLGSRAAPPALLSRCSRWPAWWSSCAARCARTRRCATPAAEAAVGPYLARPVVPRQARRGPGARPGLRRRAGPHAGRVSPPRPAGRRAGPAALPWRRLPVTRLRSAAADPVPDPPARLGLRERGLPAAAAREAGRPGGRRAPRDGLGTGSCRGVRRRARHAVPRQQLGRGEPGDPGGGAARPASRA